MANSERRAQGGFTYLWTLMLVASLGVALGIAAETYAMTVQRDREQELRFVGRQFREAIRSYYETQQQAGKHEYPPSLEVLLRDERAPGIKRHLRRIYIDPMTGAADWGLVMVAGRVAGVHSLSDKAPIKRENFEPDELALSGRERYSEWAFTYPSDLLLRPEGSKDAAPARRDEVGENPR